MTLAMRRAMDLVFQVVALLVLLVALSALAALIYDVVKDGVVRLSWDFITGYPSRRASRAGPGRVRNRACRAARPMTDRSE